MTLEEKRQFHIEMGQLFAENGINQQTIKEMVEKELSAKISRAIDQYFSKPENQNLFEDKINDWIRKWTTERNLEDIIGKVLAKKVINIELKDVVIKKGEEK